MMTARSVLGWSSSESREKFAKLPVEALVTDDESKAMDIFHKLGMLFLESCVEILGYLL